MTESVPSMFQHALRFAAVLLVCNLVMVQIPGLIDMRILASVWYIPLTFLVLLALTIIGGVKFRRVNGGYITYKRAFFYCMLALTLSGILMTAFNEVYYGFINKNFPAALADAQIALDESAAQKSATEIEEMRQDTIANFSPLGLIINFFAGIILYIVISLLAAAMVRRSENKLANLETT